MIAALPHTINTMHVTEASCTTRTLLCKWQSLKSYNLQAQLLAVVCNSLLGLNKTSFQKGIILEMQS